MAPAKGAVRLIDIVNWPAVARSTIFCRVGVRSTPLTKLCLGEISDLIETRTLKMLERDGMVERTVCSTTPPQVEYALSELGRSLSEPVRQLAQWAGAHLATIHENRLRYDTNR